MGWNIDDVSRNDLRADRQKEFNSRQVSLAKSVGENMASFACVLIVLMFVGYIWTDMKINIFSERMICDALASIVSFILVENLMAENGIRCGVLYEEYIKTHEAYLVLRDEVIKRGIGLMNVFCDWQIDVEYEFFMRKQCKLLKIDYKEYNETLSKLPLEELKERLPADKAIKVYALRQIEPIELSTEMLMTDGAEGVSKRGGVSISAREYIKRKTRGTFKLVTVVVTGFFSASIAFFGNEGASWGLVMYTLLKLALMCWRMYLGFSNGAKAYNTIEVKHLQDKMNYFYLYLEFLDKKIYLGLKDRYSIDITS